jgi:hypothetical protein
MLTVADAPPRFAVGSTPLRPAQAADACGASHSAGRPILVVLDQAPVDPEAAATAAPDGCASIAPGVRYHWSLPAQPTGVGRLGRPVLDGCPAVSVEPGLALEGGSAVCLYPDATVGTGAPSSYTVALAIDDGRDDASDETTLVQPVIGDAPACRDGAYPPPGATVLPRDGATTFNALGVDDVAASGTLR